MNVVDSYLPPSAIDYVGKLLPSIKVDIKVVKGRLTKYGDYRPGNSKKRPVISVNRDLNPYAFLITLIHELAHAVAFDHYSTNIKPHGKEWKSTFQQLMKPLLVTGVFPADIESALFRHMRNPKASTSADTLLLRILKKYDRSSDQMVLEDLPIGATFRLRNGRIFVKGEKRRKNYLCTEVKGKRKFVINPMAEIRPVEIGTSE